MRIFVCELRHHFPDSKHLRRFVCHEIFGNFFHHSELFGLHPPPPPPQLYMLATVLVPTDSTCMLAFLNESPRQSVEIELLIEQAVQFQIHSSVIFVVRNVSFIVTMKILKTIVFPSKVLQICNEFANGVMSSVTS